MGGTGGGRKVSGPDQWIEFSARSSAIDEIGQLTVDRFLLIRKSYCHRQIIGLVNLRADENVYGKLIDLYVHYGSFWTDLLYISDRNGPLKFKDMDVQLKSRVLK